MMASDLVIYAELDEEAILLNVESGVYFGLDAIGSQIWRILEHGASQSEIVRQLLDEYDVEPGQLEADIDDFLSALDAQGLIRAVEA